MNKAALIALLMVTAGFVHIYNDARLEYFEVEESGNDFLLKWETSSEESVRLFEVQRKTPYSNDEFVLVKEAGAHGINRQYLVRDTQVFKTGGELIEYRLQAVFDDGSRQILAARTVNYTPTAIRRTWGSIKAMF